MAVPEKDEPEGDGKADQDDGLNEGVGVDGVHKGKDRLKVNGCKGEISGAGVFRVTAGRWRSCAEAPGVTCGDVVRG
jgi:hypothetical protein